MPDLMLDDGADDGVGVLDEPPEDPDWLGAELLGAVAGATDELPAAVGVELVEV